MKRADLAVEKRLEKGKNHAREIRRQGKIPAVLYGKGVEPIPLSVEYRDLLAVLHGQEGHNTLLNMNIAGEEEQGLLSMPKEVQFDPIAGNIIHVDFQQIHLDEPIHTQVPIHLVGASPGVKAGGIQEHLLRELEVSCLPMDIPEYIEIDVSHLNIGDSLRVSDLKVAEGIRVLSDPYQTVVLVAAPKVEKVTEEEAAEAAEAEAEALAAAGEKSQKGEEASQEQA